MLFGASFFSFATGALSSIIQNNDHANAKLEESLNILDRIYKEYSLPLVLFEKLRMSIKYDYSKN